VIAEPAATPFRFMTMLVPLKAAVARVSIAANTR
jgi:hypothetical protein